MNRLFWLLSVVTLPLLVVGLSVTTAGAQSVAPAQCEWPVAGNLLLDGDFSDPSGSSWVLWNSVSGLTHQVVVTDHPCMYGFATGNPWATQLVTVSSQTSILASFWSRNNQPLVSGLNFDHNYFSRRYDDYNPLSTQFGFEQDLGEWTFHAICLPGHESIVESTQQFSWYNNIGPDVRDITGLSIVAVDSCEAMPTPSPTPTSLPASTAVPTASPTPIPTMTPLASSTRLPMPTATPTATIPAFYRSLPALPPPIISPPSDIVIELPEFTIQDGQNILQYPVTLMHIVGNSDWWDIIRYGIFVMLSMVMAFKVIS